MGNGYVIPASDPIDELRLILRDVLARLRELEALDGTQIYNTVQELRQLIEGALEQTEVNVSGNITTTGGNVAAPAGNVTAGGSVSASGKLFAGNWYNNNITGSGGYRAAYVSLNGEAGYVPSSIAFKRDVQTASVDPRAVLDVEVVRFRYKDAVDNMGDDAPVEIGVIAEQVAELGLPWLLDTDEAGVPVGVKYDRMALALLPALQSLARRVAALEG